MPGLVGWSSKGFTEELR